MGDEITPAMLNAQVEDSFQVLIDSIIGIEPDSRIALARATHQILLQEWTKQRRTVIKVYGGRKPIKAWQNRAVEKGKILVDWDNSAPARTLAYGNRLDSYKALMAKIIKDASTRRYLIFYQVYRKVGKIPPYAKTNLTMPFLSALNREIMEWYVRQRPSDHVVLPDPDVGMIRFLKERREFVMLLKLCHQKVISQKDIQPSVMACKVMLEMVPTVNTVVCLYRLWTSEEILLLKLNSMTEAERAILALGFLVPSAARLVKYGRLVYGSSRLGQLYGRSGWDTVIGYSAILSKNRNMQKALDDVYQSFISKGTPTQGSLNEAIKAAEFIVKSSNQNNDFAPPASIEKPILELWKELVGKFPWLQSKLFLDEYALRRMLLMGSNPSQLESQLLVETAESAIAGLLRNRYGTYRLGIEAPETSTLEFVPGHAFRTGNKNPNIANRQVTDGVIGYWEAGKFYLVAILESKVDNLGGRELGYSKPSLEKLTRAENETLRAYTNREWVESWEVQQRSSGNASKPTTSQAARDEYNTQVRDLESKVSS
jgi:hypothetical protein